MPLGGIASELHQGMLHAGPYSKRAQHGIAGRLQLPRASHLNLRLVDIRGLPCVEFIPFSQRGI